jgi:dephospho-CoA kinase
VLLVGLTGGIGAGKSTVAHELASRGAVVLDADIIVRELQRAGTPVFRRIVERFGPDIVDVAGELDRARLGAAVFADDDARAALNAIVHPEVMREIAQRTESLSATDSVVVLDVPLLVEVGGGEGLDLVVVVDARDHVRIERLARDRAMSAEEARARMSVQASDEERRALADMIINNDGDLQGLRTQIDDLWSRIEDMRRQTTD